MIHSSVAAVRVRRSNFLYGSAKAGLDAFSIGTAEAARGSGVQVQVVRPGSVHTKMPSGLPPARFAVGPVVVTAAVWPSPGSGQVVVSVPQILRWVFLVLRALPP